jgi:hypothetical protein
VSPVKYELGFYIAEDDILHSHCREHLKSYVLLRIWQCGLQVGNELSATGQTVLPAHLYLSAEPVRDGKGRDTSLLITLHSNTAQPSPQTLPEVILLLLHFRFLHNSAALLAATDRVNGFRHCVCMYVCACCVPVIVQWTPHIISLQLCVPKAVCV